MADAAADAEADWLILAGRKYRSRLLIGTGKFKDAREAQAALAASGAEIVTVAVRRIDPTGASPGPLDGIDGRYQLLPNTAGCTTVKDAVRTAHLARELGMTELLKLEVIGDPRTLFPDAEATLEAARLLVRDGFTILPYTTDDPVMARKLEDAGCAAVMPLAAPIGSGLGIRNPHNLRIMLETVRVPVIVDAGVGTASDAAVALELGCHGVLMNTGIAGARSPVLMAEAMRLAVEAGRKAFRAGRIPRRLHASASSPVDGLIE
jgi:thiazole synthase